MVCWQPASNVQIRIVLQRDDGLLMGNDAERQHRTTGRCQPVVGGRGKVGVGEDGEVAHNVCVAGICARAASAGPQPDAFVRRTWRAGLKGRGVGGGGDCFAAVREQKGELTGEEVLVGRMAADAEDRCLMTLEHTLAGARRGPDARGAGGSNKGEMAWCGDGSPDNE